MWLRHWAQFLRLISWHDLVVRCYYFFIRISVCQPIRKRAKALFYTSSVLIILFHFLINWWIFFLKGWIDEFFLSSNWWIFLCGFRASCLDRSRECCATIFSVSWGLQKAQSKKYFVIFKRSISWLYTFFCLFIL